MEPDGKLICYTSEEDGWRCFYARPVDGATKRPAGAPFAVFHSHDSRGGLSQIHLGQFEIAVARGKMVFQLAETKGNIWMRE